MLSEELRSFLERCEKGPELCMAGHYIYKEEKTSNSLREEGVEIHSGLMVLEYQWE